LKQKKKKKIDSILKTMQWPNQQRTNIYLSIYAQNKCCGLETTTRGR
jgi:hypothetical protein